MLHASNNGSHRGRKDKLGRKDVEQNLADGQDVKLHQSENAWIPSHKIKEKYGGHSQNLENELLKRNVQSVLNKLTFQKFKILLAHLMKFNIYTEEEMNLVADLIYENATYEPHFSVLYANLCKELSMVKKHGLVKQMDFITVLVTKCQVEFEKHCNVHEKKINVAHSDEIGIASEMVEMEVTCKYDKKIKAMRLGNIRFIGELFKLNLILKPILMECMDILLTKQDDESLECLCLLIKTAGKKLENYGNCSDKKDLEDYFILIEKIVDEHLTSTRIRFLLKDILELKNNNWIPRRIENVPRTIDEIHQEAAFEARQWYQNMMCVAAQSDKQDRPKTSQYECLCAIEMPSTSKNRKKLFVAQNCIESTSNTLDEARRILASEDPKRLNKSDKKRIKKKSRMKSKNLIDSADSGSISLP